MLTNSHLLSLIFAIITVWTAPYFRVAIISSVVILALLNMSFSINLPPPSLLSCPVILVG